HTGAFLPFELRLAGLRRRGTNRLVVRVDSRRGDADFPPATMTSTGVPAGGWWNAGGLLREVYLRPVRGVDLEQVTVLPTLHRALVRARVRNLTHAARRIAVTGRFGRQAFRVGRATVPAGGTRVLATRITVRGARPWTPAAPHLYPVSVRAGAARWDLHTGLRTVSVRGGRLYLNGRATSFRGVGYHEDTRERSMAITDGDRAWLLREAHALGATMMRTHYPPGPYLEELADRTGMLLWSEVPVYQMRGDALADPRTRAGAVALVRRNIEVNGSHPSVVTWSIGNELGAEVGPGQGAYIRAAAAAVHRDDPTRPAALATNGYASALCQSRYGPLDVLGLNEYYGWYPGPDGLMFDRFALSDYLDRARACYPRQALVVSEFGAEANREGPAEEKGTYAFQRDFVRFHLDVLASKPWLSGALYWALNEFRVRPGWDGGNPRPSPPVHQKGLVTYDRQRKPAWEDVRRAFSAARLYP
ncbi:MAG: glycoside hydrolase family 2 protein, partial [Solirubrobacteraceae bacterium]